MKTNVRQVMLFFGGIALVGSIQGCNDIAASVKFKNANAKLVATDLGAAGNEFAGDPPADDVTGSVAQTGTDASSETPVIPEGPVVPSGPGNSDHTKNPKGPNGNSDASGGIVECELNSPAWKITSGGTDRIVAQHSNAARTRICMSSNSCLNVINAYVAARGGELVTGAPTTPGVSVQYTKRFPGSKGTCHNATLVSDAEIVALLLAMGGV